MLFADFPGTTVSAPVLQKQKEEWRYRTPGSEPAGSGMRPGVEVWRKNKRHISNRTRHGKITTRPRGTETVESLFSRMRRWRKARLAGALSVFVVETSGSGYDGCEEMRFLVL